MHRLMAILAWVALWFGGSGVATIAAEPAADRAAGEPRPFVAPLFGDRMVLQHSRPNTFWGWAKPGATVAVRIGARIVRGVADAEGKWRVAVVPPAEAGEYTIAIDGARHVELRHVTVGTIWVCVGPPPVREGRSRVESIEERAGPIDRTRIRFFVADGSPEPGRTAHWIDCPERAELERSGVCEAAYALACVAQKETEGIVGVVQDFTGECPIEEWLGRPAAATMRARTDASIPAKTAVLGSTR